jgi:putative membrane protein
MKLLIGWVINIGALLALPYLLSGIKISDWKTAAIVAVVLGLLNVLIKPLLFLLTLPISILTLGLFTFVINGFLFWLAARLIDGFSVDGFGWAMAGAIAYSLISWAVSSLLLSDKSQKAN